MRLTRLLPCTPVLAGLLLVAGASFAQATPPVQLRPEGGAAAAARPAGPGLPVRSAAEAQAVPGSARQPGPAVVADVTPQATRAFTYQGLLRASGLPLNGPCDLQFTIWNAASAGTALSAAQTLTTNVTDGLFTVTLNDASQFPDSVLDGRAVWVEIAVRSPSGSGAYTTLSPRQPLTAAPIASTLAPHGVIRSGDTFNGYPALTVDARAEAFGNPEALRVYAVPSNRWLSFSPSALWADSDAGAGVVGVTRAGTGVFGGAAEEPGWAGYFSGNVKITGKLEVARLHSLIAINSIGPLPLSSGTFTTYGGTLRIQYSGSGYTSVPSRLIGMTVKLDGTAFDQTGIFANNSGMHLAFVSKEWVLTGIPAGTHTLTLEAMAGTATDGNDIFSATVTELPY